VEGLRPAGRSSSRAVETNGLTFIAETDRIVSDRIAACGLAVFFSIPLAVTAPSERSCCGAAKLGQQ
jgi:hypothetical protein